jgi:U3 small nucleolar RNA-associated protein 15
VLDLYADQLGRSPEVDMLVEQLMQRVKVVVEASQVAWSVLGMVDMLTVGAEAGAGMEVAAEV